MEKGTGGGGEGKMELENATYGGWEEKGEAVLEHES